MSPDDVRRSQKPYRYGMILLCFGALINWVGLAEKYTEPIRYAGVACIVGGALLICTAMCCWLHSPPRNAVGAAGTRSGSGEVRLHRIRDCLKASWCFVFARFAMHGNFSADFSRRHAAA